MILSAIFLLLQYNRRADMDRDFQNMMMVGRFIFGMFIARIISIVLILILAFTLMRAKRIRAVVTAHAVTFLFCVIFLVVGWLRVQGGKVEPPDPRLGGQSYAISKDFPFDILLIYSICIAIWFLIDFGIAKLIEKSKAKKDTAPVNEIRLEPKKDIISEESN